MAVTWFRLKNARSFQTMGAPKDRKKGDKLILYSFTDDKPVRVTNPVDQEYFRGRKELVLECTEDGTPILEGNPDADYGAVFAGKAISFQRFKLGPKYANMGAVSANTANAPVPTEKDLVAKNRPLPRVMSAMSPSSNMPTNPSTIQTQSAVGSSLQPSQVVTKGKDTKTNKKTKKTKKIKEKKYVCENCGKSYASRSGLLYHKKRGCSPKDVASFRAANTKK